MVPQTSPPRLSWRLKGLVVLAAVLVLGLFWALGLPDGESVRFNSVWSRAVSAEFWQGTPYPRHLPELWQGLGGLDLFFYAPMPFWLTELLARPLCQGCPDDRVLALSGAVLLLLSGVAFHFAARTVVHARAALGGALIYMLMPYHLWVDWFQRQAAGEFAAFIFAPIFFLGAYRILQGGGGTMLAIGLAGLMFSHLPVALLAVHVLAAIGLVWLVWHLGLGRFRTAGAGFARTLVYGLLGGALAAIYWVPAIALLGDVSSDWLYLDYFQPARWLFLDGTDAPDPAFQQRMVALLAAGCVLTLPALAMGAARTPAYWLLAVTPAATVALSMSALSAPLWQVWIIDKVQFPWRSLVFVDFAAAFAIALALHHRAYAMWPTTIRLAAMAAVVAGSALSMPDGVRAILRGPLNLAEGMPMAGAAEYTPRPLIEAAGVHVAPDHRWLEWTLLVMREEIDTHQPDILPGTLTYRRYSVQIPAGQTEAVLRLPYWHHWRAEDPAVTLSPQTTYGMTQITVPVGTRHVDLHLPWHWSEWIGAALSALAALGLLFGSFLRVRRRRTPLAQPAEDRI